MGREGQDLRITVWTDCHWGNWGDEKGLKKLNKYDYSYFKLSLLAINY